MNAGVSSRPGVGYEVGRFMGARYHLVRIDRDAADVVVKPYLTDRPEGDRVSDMDRKGHSIATVNGTFFDMATPGKTIYGDVKTDDRSYRPQMVKKRTWWAVKPDRTMVMGETVRDSHGNWSIPSAAWSGFKYVLGGGGRLLKDGKPASIGAGINDEQFQPDVLARRNRSGVGFTDKQLVMVSCDDPGWTPEELAKFMQSQGMSDAMLLDAGGSTEMLVDHKIVTPLSAGAERWEPTALIAQVLT